MKRAIAFLLLSLISSSCIKHEAEFEAILKLEDQRQPCHKLLPFLKNPEPMIRTRALEAMGKLQDSTCVFEVTKLLNDVNHNVRLTAAFALGQMGSATAEEALIRRLTFKDVVAVKRRILEALGKIGTTKTLSVLRRQFRSLQADVRAEAALAAGRLARRGLRDPALTNETTKCLQDGHAEVRWQAAYALMRVGETVEPEPLMHVLQDPDPRVRMFAVRALGNLKAYTFPEPLGNVLRSDTDWRVRVNAASALANYPLTLGANYLTLLDQPQQVRVAIIQAIGLSAALQEGGYRENSRELNLAKNQIEQLFTGSNGHEEWTIPEIGFGLIAYAKLMGEKAIPTIARFSAHENSRLRARAMEALGEIGSRNVARILEASYDSSHSVIKIAILEAVSKIKGYYDPKVYLSALGENDPVLVAIAAEKLSADSLRNKIHAGRVVSAYQNLPKPVDPESAQMIFAALAKFRAQEAVPLLENALASTDGVLARAASAALTAITGSDSLQVTLNPSTAQPRYQYSEILELQGAHAIIRTERGDIEFELLAEAAPLTVLNFARLAERSFYDGLTFHRVAPNFVTQGGDPRGDGWGGPDYSIRSEFNKHNYLRGMVGMASAGKDTEGCQFFITHSPQPHLDGRYTIFGRVTSGMDIVDLIQEGDVIESVVIRR